MRLKTETKRESVRARLRVKGSLKVRLSEIEKIYIVLKFYELEFDRVSYQAIPEFIELEYGGLQISPGTRAILAFRELGYCVLH